MVPTLTVRNHDNSFNDLEIAVVLKIEIGFQQLNPLFTFLSVLLLIYQSPKYLENCGAMALGRQNSKILSPALPSFYNLFLR